MNALKHIFSIMKLDGRIVVIFFGLQLKFKYKYSCKTPTVSENGVTDVKRSPRIIVSLTSFPARINTVNKTISTLLTQTLKPDEIILWLAQSQFPKKKLPQNLTKLENFGLKIKWCDDLRSYKKLLPALKEYPEDIIITTDDDVYYDANTLETLYNSYKNEPNCVHAHRCGRLCIKSDVAKTLPTVKVYLNKFENPSFFNILIGSGAVLYPPYVFYKDILNTEKIKTLLPTHDDVWFWAMATLNNTKTRVVKGFKYSLFNVEGSQEHALCKVNLPNIEAGLGLNDAYNRIINEYPQIIQILKTEGNGK